MHDAADDVRSHVRESLADFANGGPSALLEGGVLNFLPSAHRELSLPGVRSCHGFVHLLRLCLSLAELVLPAEHFGHVRGTLPVGFNELEPCESWRLTHGSIWLVAPMAANLKAL